MLRPWIVRLALVTSILAVAPLVTPRVAHAQAPSRQVREAAREAYARGQEAFRDGRFAEAESAFEEAFGHIPNPIVLLGLAEARERLGNVPGAISALDAYLVNRPDAPDADAVRDRLATLRATPGTLVVQSVPGGAAVLLDGSDTGQITPAELQAHPGPHTVSLRLEGYELADATVDVGPGGSTEVEVALTAMLAPVVEPEPPAAEPLEEPEPEVTTPASTGPGTAVWVTSGIAAASLVGGTILGFMALSRQAQFDDDPMTATANEGDRFALFADVLFSVAAVSAITAIVLFLTRKSPEEQRQERVQIAPHVGPRGGGVGARLVF